jgi:type I restriction enzyme S subunit
VRLDSTISVPLAWEIKPLKRLSRFGYGEALAAEERDSTGPVKVYGSNGPFDQHSVGNTLGPCIIVGRKGSYGKCVYSEEPVFAVDTTFVIDRRHTSAVLRYVFHLLGVLGLDELSDDTAVPGLSREKAYQWSVPVPPLEIQRRIAAFLDEKTPQIDALIQKKQALLDRLAEKRRAIITQAVTKGLNPAAPMKDTGIDWLGQIPAHWEVKRVKHVAKLESGHTPDKKVEEYWLNGNIPWVSLNDTAEIRANDYIADTKFKTNDLGIANSSARLLPARAVVFTRDATIGESAITTRPMAVSQHLIAWICDQRIITPEYLLLLIYGMTGELLRLTNGATIGTIGLGDVKELRVCVAPIEEQLEIVKRVFNMKERIDRASRIVEASQDRLIEYRSSLISAAVTGQNEKLQ